MNKKTFTLAFFLCLTVLAQARHIDIGTVSGTTPTFAPNYIDTVKVGDTIRFIFDGGAMAHNTQSILTPAGALPWGNPTPESLDMTHPMFSYKVTVAGTYAYHCTFHPSSMTGGFRASFPTGVNNIIEETAMQLSPNPVSSVLFIKTDLTELSAQLYDVSGKLVSSVLPVKNGNGYQIDVSNVSSGLYIIKINRGEMMLTKRILIAR